MILECKTNYLNVKKKIGVKDPSKTYYSVNVFDGNDCCSFNIEECLFDVFEGLEPMTPVKLTLDYNASFNSMKVRVVSLLGAD